MSIITKVSNNTQEALIIEGSCKGSIDDSRIFDYEDRQIKRFSLGINEHKTIQQKVFLPESLSVKTIENYLTFHSVLGDSLSAYQTIIF